MNSDGCPRCGAACAAVPAPCLPVENPAKAKASFAGFSQQAARRVSAGTERTGFWMGGFDFCANLTDL